MKKNSMWLLICLMVFGFAVGKALAVKKKVDGTIEMRFATGVPANSLSGQQVDRFCDEVARKTSGKVRFTVFHDSQLGQEAQLVEACGLGTVDMVMSDAAYIANLYSAIGVLDFMYVYRDMKGYRNVLASGIFDELSRQVSKRSGIIPLVPLLLGVRHVITVDRPIRQPSDAKGMLLRSSPSELSQYFIRTLGGTPTPIPWPETYMALKQGVVKGAECTFDCIYYGKWHEVCNYLSLTGHVYTNEIVSISQAAWKILSPEQQKIIRETANNTALWKLDQLASYEEEYMGKLKTDNPKLQVIEITPEAKSAFKRRAAGFAQDLKQKYAKDNWGDYYEKVVKLGWE